MDNLIQEIGNTILHCEDVQENEWESLSVVFDLGDNHTSNSGFLYTADKIKPMTASITGEVMTVVNKIREFQSAVEQKYGKKFKQLLVQMEKESGRIKIDFEFDDSKRWNMGPSNYIKMREALRPEFD